MSTATTTSSAPSSKMLMLRSSQSGFTLVEMALVIVVMGLIGGMIYPAITALRTSTARATTQTNLRGLMLATAAYVQANGCLPCPGYGQVGTTGSSRCGKCPNPEGLVPFASLGLPMSMARDGWGYWITMRVDPMLTTFTNVPVYTQQNGQAYLCQSGLASNSISVTYGNPAKTMTTAVIFISHGHNGYGAIATTDEQIINGFPAGASNSAIMNGANPGNTTTHAFVDDITNSGYDDMLIYADRNALVSMLGNGACQSAWPAS